MRNSLWCIHVIALASIGSAALDAGTIYGLAGISSAEIQLTGMETLTVSSNSQGYYAFHGLLPGNYVITPVLRGYVFSPQSVAVTVSNEHIGSVNFTATANATTGPSAPKPPTEPTEPTGPTQTNLTASPASVSLNSVGATVQLQIQATFSAGNVEYVTSNATYASNNNSVATVSQSGVVTAISQGSATIIASYGGMAASIPVNVNILGGTYSVSGSAGIGSATVSISGAFSGTITASSSGAYSFSGLTPGNYIITPSLSGYTFSPASQSATITNANVSGLSFTANTAESHLVELTWAAGTIPDPVAGEVIVGYNVYRSTTAGGPYTQLNSSPVVALTYSDSAVSAGQTLYYVCSTVDSLGNVSGYSNQASATVPTS